MWEAYETGVWKIGMGDFGVGDGVVCSNPTYYKTSPAAASFFLKCDCVVVSRKIVLSWKREVFPGVEDGLLNPTLFCLRACILRLGEFGKKAVLSRKREVLPGLRMQLLAYKKLELDFEDLAGRFLVRGWSCLIQCYLTDELVYCDCADVGS